MATLWGKNAPPPLASDASTARVIRPAKASASFFAAGSMSREFRRAAYDRRLRWAQGAGLNPRTGFRGLHREVGTNPALELLDAALSARVEALAPAQGDPFEGLPELLPVALAA